MKLCSACLLGVRCRYDGQSKASEKVLELARHETLVPVCPEQMGGLPTPREACERVDGRAKSKSGKDYTDSFKKGAQEVLDLAKRLGIQEAILKQRSPSCASGQSYDGSFSGTIVKGDGITAALLRANGIKVISEEDL
jgi:uncharacterized protein YbbK (DUF523 family)